MTIIPLKCTCFGGVFPVHGGHQKRQHQRHCLTWEPEFFMHYTSSFIHNASKPSLTMAILKPIPHWPNKLTSGIRQSSRIRFAVDDALIPSLSSFFPRDRPGWGIGTRKALIPWEYTAKVYSLWNINVNYVNYICIGSKKKFKIITMYHKIGYIMLFHCMIHTSVFSTCSSI